MLRGNSRTTVSICEIGRVHRLQFIISLADITVVSLWPKTFSIAITKFFLWPTKRQCKPLQNQKHLVIAYCSLRVKYVFS